MGILDFLKGGDKIDLVEWVHKKTDNKTYQRRIRVGVPIKYNKTNDSHYVEYLNQIVPVKHNYLENYRILNVINIEGSLVPIDLEDLELEITDMDTTTEKREDVISKVVQRINPSVIDRAYEMAKRKDAKHKDNLLDAVKSAPSDQRGNYNAKILKLLAMPMDVRSWYVINLKRIAQKGQGFWDKHGTKLMMLLVLIFDVAIVWIIFTHGGELARKMAVDTVKVTVETMSREAIAHLNIKNFTISADVTTTTSTLKLPIPI